MGNAMFMLKKRILLLVIVTSSLFMSGCNLPVKNEQETNPQTERKIAQTNGVGQEIVITSKDPLNIDDQIRVPKQNSEGYVTAKIESIYYSALGNQCIQLTVKDKNQKRLFCKKTQSKWIEMPLIDNLVIEPIE